MTSALATRCRALLPLIGAAWLCGAAPVRAQVAVPDAMQLQQRLEQSLRLIDALAARVDQLERQLASKARASPPSAAPMLDVPPAPEGASAARIDAIEKTVEQLSASSGRESRDGGLPLHGFADVGWATARHAPAGQKSGFAIGSLDFYLTPELGNVRTLVELNAGIDGNGETEIDLERAQIGYGFSDQLTLWLGRFHTPFGYWNMAFHHGAQIQPSILRPRLLDFEDQGGILPVHTTGIWGTGSVRTGSGKLVYHAYAGNGTRIHDGRLDPNPGGDDNANKVVGFGLVYRFAGALDGVSMGAHGLRQTVSAVDVNDMLLARTRLMMFGGHVVYDNRGFEAIAEAYRLHNTDLSGGTGTHDSTAGYLHLGYSLDDRWMPYARWERASLAQADSYFALLANGRSYTRQLLGVRFNADPRAAVKLEWNRTDDQGVGRSVDQLRLQYAVGF